MDSRLRTWFLGLTISGTVLTGPTHLVGQTPKSAEMRQHLLQGQEALKANRPEVAEKEFREVLTLDPKNAEVHANLGLIAFGRARYEEAASNFRKAITLKPSLWSAQAYLGLSQARLGRVREAVSLLDATLPRLQDPILRTRVGLELIQMHYEAKEFAKALDALEVIRRASPDSPDILYTTYRLHSDLAAQALGTLAQVAPQSVQMYQIVAQAAESQDDVSGAIAQYRKALEVDPTRLDLHRELGRLILVMSQDEPARQQAEKEFEAELSLNPADANSEYELGEIYWLRSDLATAALHYTRALDLKRDFVDAQIALGKVLLAQDQFDKALVEFQEAARLDPRSEAAHYRLAQALRKLGRNREAQQEEAEFQRLRESQSPLRSLYHQALERPTAGQTVETPTKHP